MCHKGLGNYDRIYAQYVSRKDVYLKMDMWQNHKDKIRSVPIGEYLRIAHIEDKIRNKQLT